MKKLINAVGTVVPEMLEGLVRANPGIAVLDGQTIVARRDHRDLAERGTVAIISGGGAGHEPAHAGYVGDGMLTAAMAEASAAIQRRLAARVPVDATAE